jgi:hypothetical protein
LYAELCAQVFGQFLHHEPADEVHMPERMTSFDFRIAYTHLFGDPGPIWELGWWRSQPRPSD